ncbi:phospholipase D-like domain-containing protein, partial [Burkholderia pseudomallei]|nr:phospholipase D-like domain-containing protein [Burkholderia pseudomallei]
MTTPYPSPPDARANRAAEARAHGGLLEPGRNCDALLHAERFATLIDGDAYFSTLRAALRRARHTVFIVGWDIDSRLRLVPDGAHDGWPEPLAAFLHALANARRRLRIYVLAWDFSMIYALEREWPPVYRTAWRSRHGIVFRLDGTHPRGASHHQKFVVIDDRVAFVGGFDLTRSRWDTPRHAPDEPRRVDPNGARYAPFHDVQAMFDGDAAAAIGALARERWARTCGKRVAIRAHRRRAADDDPWPPGAPVDVRDVTLAIALTTPRHRGGDEVGHIRALTADAIAAARRDLYIENQYFTAAVVREALTARLAADDPPDVVVVAPREQSGWLQEATMGVLRARLHRALVDADRHGRYRLLCPHVDGLGELCVNVHSKLMCVDDDYLVIGSANLNNRSMVLDTECNIVLAANGEPRVREAIARTRERLLAEHLGVSADAVAAARACTGRLNRAIDALRGAHPHRTLRPFTPSASADLDALVPVSAWLDPERPIDADRLMSEFVPREQSRSLTARFLALGAFVLFAAALAAAWRFTPLGQHLSVASLARAGARAAELPAAPVALVAGYVAAALLAVPVTLLITATGLVFGAWPG